jgi:hypothetical protein
MLGEMSAMFSLCPYCGEQVDPDAEGVVYARQQVDAPGFGQKHDVIDGLGAFFHPMCPPESVGYARRPKPAQF